MWMRLDSKRSGEPIEERNRSIRCRSRSILLLKSVVSLNLLRIDEKEDILEVWVLLERILLMLFQPNWQRDFFRRFEISILPKLQKKKKEEELKTAQNCTKYSIELLLEKMSKIVQYDNLLVNFAYFGAFIENIEKKKGGGVQFLVQSRLHAVLVRCLNIS